MVTATFSEARGPFAKKNNPEKQHEKQKTGARKYSATPVSKPNRDGTKAGGDIMSVLQNSNHTLRLHTKFCGASLKDSYIIQ